MIDRRTFFRSAGTATGAALLAGGAVTAVSSAALADPATGIAAAARFDRPLYGFAPAGTRLRHGTPRQLGLDPAPISSALAEVRGWTEPDPVTGHPLFSGAVCMLVHNGVIVRTGVAGKALRYADRQGTELPAGEQIPMHQDTIFDMASISKLFTSIVGLQLVESGRLDVDAPVAEYLPAYG
ncbi:MAG: serine hydrolase, partial [Sciscionella sp.]